jgi:hypothetical protein
VNNEPITVTEKVYALSVYYQTPLKVLPVRNVRKDEFTAEEAMILTKIQGFRKNQRTEIMVRIENEIKIVDSLIAKHYTNQMPT